MLEIKVIGDSWVSANKLDEYISAYLTRNKILNNVRSYGQPGANTKKVFGNLFLPAGAPFSSCEVFSTPTDYCCIVTGVNDSLSQRGSNFYTKHLMLIIRSLLKRDIKPIVVSLPVYGILEQTNELSTYRRFRNAFMAHWNNKGNEDNINDYRKEFKNTLRDSGLKNEIGFIDFNTLWTDYEYNLDKYVNHSHLSEKGNQALGQAFGEIIFHSCT